MPSSVIGLSWEVSLAVRLAAVNRQLESKATCCCRMRSPSNVPLSSQSLERGSFVTIRRSGLKFLAFHPEAEFITIQLKCPVSRAFGPDFTFPVTRHWKHPGSLLRLVHVGRFYV